MKNFPTWEESLNGITDSRIVGHPKINPKDVNLAKDGARIMYDRLYIMLNASQQSNPADNNCTHPGCKAGLHITHPCEVCGRIGGR